MFLISTEHIGLPVWSYNVYVCVCAHVHLCVHTCACTCSVMSDSLQSRGQWPRRLFCPWGFPGKNTGVSCHFLLQKIFSTQRLKPGLLHWLADSLLLTWEVQWFIITESLCYIPETNNQLYFDKVFFKKKLRTNYFMLKTTRCSYIDKTQYRLQIPIVFSILMKWTMTTQFPWA